MTVAKVALPSPCNARQYIIHDSSRYATICTMARDIVRVAAYHDIPPGRMIYVEIDGLPIALANVAGVIYAFSDSCRHEGGPLSSGVLIGETVTCPWHGWTYNVRSGKAIVPPVGIRIPTYETRIEGNDVFVVLDWPD
jgi:nitrite reductase/ring-hydroxylating ferredoxin subunit